MDNSLRCDCPHRMSNHAVEKSRLRGLKVRWFGHATFLMTSPKGLRLLFDPFLTNNPACPPSAKRVGPVDLMLITHGHADHCEDAASIGRDTGATVVTSPELAGWLERQGLKHLRPMNIGGRQNDFRHRDRDGACAAQQQCIRWHLPWTRNRVCRSFRRRTNDLLCGRHRPVQRHAPDSRSVCARDRISADWRSLHDGARRCGALPQSGSA